MHVQTFIPSGTLFDWKTFDPAKAYFTVHSVRDMLAVCLL